jgi:hypothetical protein
MRSNGLTASAYTPVADLDPRVADALLQELKERGVAAYTKPVESSSVSGFDRPEFRTGEFRTGVQDRLYVDAAESDRVKALISDHDPGLVTASDDLTWAQIVAGFDQPLRDDAHPWPVTEDLDPGGTAVADPEVPGTAPDRRTELRRWLARRDATGTENDEEGTDEGAAAARGDVDDTEDEERFVPEPPPPLPQLEPWQQLAWVGLLGGPILLLIAVLFSISLPTWASLLAVVGFVGGFITLVARMDNGDSEDDPDGGAVV